MSNSSRALKERKNDDKNNKKQTNTKSLLFLTVAHKKKGIKPLETSCPIASRSTSGERA